jgi:hypothetical protein
MALFNRPKKKKSEQLLSRKRAKRRLSTLQLQIIVGIVLALLIALLITLVWYVTRIPSLQITDVAVYGGTTIPHEAIAQKADTLLTGRYLALIPRRFAPLYPKDEIHDAIASLERVRNVALSLDGQTLAVVFDEYVPYALWCERPESATCLFMDNEGYAFAPSPELEGSALVRYVEDGRVPETKSTGFDSAFLKETARFTDLLESKLGMYVTGVRKIGDYDIEYTVAGGGVLKVSQRMSAEETFSNLQAILASDAFADIAPGSFQYIDLRFGEKIFVNTQDPNAATSSETSNTQ